MALTADQIQARIDALQKARDAGVMRVRHGQDEIFFVSPGDMDKTLQKLKADLAAALGQTPRSRVNYLEQTSKGFGHCRPNGDNWTSDDGE